MLEPGNEQVRMYPFKPKLTVKQEFLVIKAVFQKAKKIVSHIFGPPPECHVLFEWTLKTASKGTKYKKYNHRIKIVKKKNLLSGIEK